MMRRRAFVIVLSTLLLTIGLTPGASLASGSTTDNVVVAAANGPVPGCPPAEEHLRLKVPANGGKAVRTIKAPFIFHAWWNNGHPSVVNKWWNPGVPPFPPNGQGQIKFMVRRGTWKVYGAGGNFWKYKPYKACRRNLPFEFRNGDLPIKKASQLVELGLIRQIH